MSFWVFWVLYKELNSSGFETIRNKTKKTKNKQINKWHVLNIVLATNNDRALIPSKGKGCVSPCIISSFLHSTDTDEALYLFLGGHNKAPQTGGLNNRRLFSHRSGGREPKITVSLGLVPSEPAAAVRENPSPQPPSFEEFSGNPLCSLGYRALPAPSRAGLPLCAALLHQGSP